MIIKKMTFDHFRQFYGIQTIQFAGFQDHRLVTVILGENGRGKTGIYRGLLFALYGDIHLDQDPAGSKIILANTKALQEDLRLENKGVTSSVTVEFVHEGADYTLKRSMLSIQDEGGTITEQPKQVLLSSNQGLPETDPQKVDQFVNRILDSRVKNYFFFDGERIERLTRVSQHQRKEIEYGIKNLLNIDQLLKAQKIIRMLNDKLTKKLQKHSTGDYRKKLQEKIEVEARQNKTRGMIQQLMDQLLTKEEKIEEIEAELENHQQGAEQIKQYQLLERNLKEKRVEYHGSLRRLRDFNGILQLLLAKDTLLRVNRHLDILIDNHQDGVEVSVELLRDILKEMTCICGTEVRKGTPAFDRIKSLEKTLSSKVEKRYFYQLNSEINKLIGYLEDRESELDYLLEEVQRKGRETESVKKDMDYLGERLRNMNLPDLGSLHKQRSQYVEEKLTLEQQIDQQKKILQEKENKLNRLELELNGLKRKSGIHQKLAQKQEAVSKAMRAIESMIKKYEEEVIVRLEKMTTSNLKRLLDESGKLNIKEVKVGRDYSLEVLNSYGYSFLANISQGQRQVLSLSFISALAQIAGGKEMLEMPLFMDTPFGRLSSTHQMNLLSFIPKVCSQWVLLVTDREFGSKEKEVFMQSNCWSKFYVLESVEPGVTKIVELNSCDTAVALKE